MVAAWEPPAGPTAERVSIAPNAALFHRPDSGRDRVPGAPTTAAGATVILRDGAGWVRVVVDPCGWQGGGAIALVGWVRESDLGPGAPEPACVPPAPDDRQAFPVRGGEPLWWTDGVYAGRATGPVWMREHTWPLDDRVCAAAVAGDTIGTRGLVVCVTDPGGLRP